MKSVKFFVLPLMLVLTVCGEVPAQTKAPVLLYQGHGSIRITTADNKVIYIDPYAGEGYDLPADLILVTDTRHFDHSQVSKVARRNNGCRVITNRESNLNGRHQTFDLGFVKVEAVEAGYNSLHPVTVCVGYILTFNNGVQVYVTGDTSKTRQMPLLASRKIDYAFFCADGIYNMDLPEAAECAALVKAKHSIPYHLKPNALFDRSRAEAFVVAGRLIIADGEEITLE